MKTTPVTHNDLLSAVSYCSSSGIFTRAQAAGNTKTGSIIGSLDAKGYIKALVNGHYVKLHRLAWFYVYGVWPIDQIDHINGIKTDNRIENLRVCNTHVNCLNQQGPRTNNKLGYQGVHQIMKTGRYRACCSLKGTKYHLGVFSTAEEAFVAYTAFKAPHIPERV